MVDIIYLLKNLNIMTDICKSVFLASLYMVFAIFIFSSLYWLFKKDKGLIILPFDTPIDEKTYTGKLISQSLAAELIKIQRIYQPKENKNSEENIYIPLVNPIMRSNYIGMYFEKIICFPINLQKENLEIKASDVGEFSALGIKINVGSLLSILKSIWPFSSSPNYITGNFQKNNSFVKLIALMEYPSSHSWEVHNSTKNEIQISEMIKDLAFKIAYDLAKDEMKNKIQIKNWQSFKWFTKALYYYSEYTNNGQAKQLQKVNQAFKKAILKYEKSSNVWGNYGNVLMELNNIETDKYDTETKIKDALKAYENALKYTPTEFEDVPYKLNNLGNALVESYRINNDPSDLKEAIEKYREAIEKYREAIEKYKNPTNKNYLPNIYNNLGNALIENHRITKDDLELKEAIKIFRENISLKSIDDLTLVSMYTNLGVGLLVKSREAKDIRIKITDIDEAIEVSQKAFELAPNDYPRLCQIAVNMGNMYIIKNEKKKALDQYYKGLKINPKSGGAYYNLACYYALEYKNGNSKDDKIKVLCYLKKAIKLDKFYKNFMEKDESFNLFREQNDEEYIKLVNNDFTIDENVCDEKI